MLLVSVYCRVVTLLLICCESLGLEDEESAKSVLWFAEYLILVPDCCGLRLLAKTMISFCAENNITISRIKNYCLSASAHIGSLFCRNLLSEDVGQFGGQRAILKSSVHLILVVGSSSGHLSAHLPTFNIAFCILQ